MASFSAARSVFRSAAARSSAARFVSQTKTARSPFPAPARSPVSCNFRCPVEMSFCVESLLPYHTATASSLMTSKLSISRSATSWLLEACNDDL